VIRTSSLVTALVLATFAPRPAVADRGALTVELGAALTWWPSLPPPVGSGPGVAGTAGGGIVGVRYGLRNDVELSLTGFYELPAEYTFSGVSLTVGAGTYAG
jgi:hypothetical protein